MRHSQPCLSVAFPRKHTARPTSSTLSHLLVLHRNPAFAFLGGGEPTAEVKAVALFAALCLTPPGGTC